MNPETFAQIKAAHKEISKECTEQAVIIELLKKRGFHRMDILMYFIQVEEERKAESP